MKTIEKKISLSYIEEMLRHSKPKTKESLWHYISYFYGLRIPRASVCKGHCAPFDYISGSFFGELGDVLVWANRGGGKTENGAVLTLLDSIFRSNCSTRILGGSLDQSLKMYKYIKEKLGRGFEDHLEREPTKRETKFLNGSTIEVLTQSPRSVRGPHVQRLRCDEIDEFNPEVWDAVQFVTTSSEDIKATFEGLSTMHKPYGIFQEAVESGAYKVLKFCVWETIEKCQDYSCSRCPLSERCQGKARNSDGFIPIGDIIRIYNRSSDESWISEEENKRPSFRGRVYKVFKDEEVENGGHICQNFTSLPSPDKWDLYLTIDWGTENPFCALLVGFNKSEERFYIIREIYKTGLLLRECAELVKNWGPLSQYQGVYADPKGSRERKEFKNLGITTQKAKVGILDGIEMVRQNLKPSPIDHRPKLFVSKGCMNVRKEFLRYCFPKTWKNGKVTEIPDDRNNHTMDALKNLLLSLRRPSVHVRRI